MTRILGTIEIIKGTELFKKNNNNKLIKVKLNEKQIRDIKGKQFYVNKNNLMLIFDLL